jgi:SOS-response transcriptional repressor LexA
MLIEGDITASRTKAQRHPVPRLRSTHGVTIGARARARRNQLKKRAEDVAREAGIAVTTLYDFERGDIHEITGLHRLADALETTTKALEGREPHPDKISLAGVGATGDARLSNDFARQAPILSWAALGSATQVLDPLKLSPVEGRLPAPPRAGARSFYLRVRGIANENQGSRPSFADGDMICVDPQAEPRHGSMVIVRVGREPPELRQLVIEPDGRYLKALNPAWPKKIVPFERGAHILGVVVGMWLDL